MSLREFPTDEDFFKFEKEWSGEVSYHEEYCEEIYEEKNKSCEINDRLDTASTKEDLENSYKEASKPTNSSVPSSNNDQSIQNLKMMIYSTLGIRGYEGIYASSLAREFQKDWSESLGVSLSKVGYSHIFDLINDFPNDFYVDENDTVEPVIYPVFSDINANLEEVFTNEPKSFYRTDVYEKVPRNVEKYFCELCNATCNDNNQFELHMNGKNHKKKERLQKDADNKYFCELCKVSATDAERLQLHFDGKQHQKKLQQNPLHKCNICNVWMTMEEKMFHVHKESSSNPNKVDSTENKENTVSKKAFSIGVIASEANDRYVIYCPEFTAKPFLMFEDVKDKEELQVGTWLEFGYSSPTDREKHVTNYKKIESKFPTRSFMNTIQMKVDLTIPYDYEPFNYDSKVSAQFIKEAFDFQLLIDPRIHCGRTLKAVVQIGQWQGADMTWRINKIFPPL